MCLIGIAWNAVEGVPLIIAANRDEWFERPTAPMAWWADHPNILAGRDLRAGGTWMGFTRTGRFAVVTNIRKPQHLRQVLQSRGSLVADFLLSPNDSPRGYLTGLRNQVGLYEGFNLVVGDLQRQECWHVNSDERIVAQLAPGFHALSNANINTPWPKSRKIAKAMAAVKGSVESLFVALEDSAVADTDLPQTGVPHEWERRLSAVRIVGDDYGTRSSTVSYMDWRGAKPILAVEEKTWGYKLAADSKVNCKCALTFDLNIGNE